MKFINTLITRVLPKDSIKSRGAMLVLATIISNFFAFLFNAYLGRSIRIEDFALISAIGSILSLSDIITGSLSKSVTFRSAYFLGKYNKPATKFWRYLRKRSLIVSLALCLLWVFSSPAVASFFKFDSLVPVLALTPVWIAMVISSIDGGYLTGNMKFGFVALASIVDSSVKFFIAVLLVTLGLGGYVYFSIALSSIISCLVIVVAAQRLRGPIKASPRKFTQSFPYRFYVSNILSRVSTTAYLTVDVILAKHFLSGEQAGQYALLALAGKTVFLAGSFFAQFVTPIVSLKEGGGAKSEQIFHKLLLATFASSMIAYIVIGPLSSLTMPFLFGKNALPIVSLVPLYALSMVAFTLASAIVEFYQVKSRYLLPYISFGIAIVQIIAIFWMHASVTDIAQVMIALGFTSLIVVGLIHLFYSRFVTIAINLKDFIDLFMPAKKTKQKGLRIFIFNWRDTKHIWAGGAEAYIHELAKRWVKNGNTVTLFCGNDQLNARNEIVDGVKIIRRGGFYTVYLWAFLYFVFRFRNKVDVIIDSENGIPFFSPLFSSKPVILLMHHVHQDIFAQHMKFPLSYIGKFIEGKIMPAVYRNKTIITVSESSKSEIVRAAIAKEKNIQIINPGIEIPSNKYAKSKVPTIIYLGRLKAYKNIHIAIYAFAKIVKDVKSARLWIVGDGEIMGQLKKIVSDLGLEDRVHFFGHVSELMKVELLSKSWVAVQPSQIEGWGITVIEANSCKTPVVATNTKGLCDSIVMGKTGDLVKRNDIDAFARHIKSYLVNSNRRKLVSKNAYIWAHKFNWTTCAEAFYEIILSEVERKESVFSLKKASYAVNRMSSVLL